MAKGINIPIASDTKDFSKGVKTGVIDNLEDLVDVLDDVAREGDTAGSKLERSLDDAADSADDLAKAGKDAGGKVEDAMRDASDKTDDLAKAGDTAGDKLEDAMKLAQKETKELATEHKALGDVIKAESQKSAKAFVKSHDEGIAGGKAGLEDFKGEANSTAKESAASFDGSAESIVSSFQEVAANAFGGFGPAGAVAGLAAAAGIGLVTAAFTQAGEDAEVLAEKTQKAFDQMLESKSEFIGQEFILSNMKDLINDTEKMAEVTRDAEAAGVSEATMLRARAGDTAALSDVQNALTAKQKALAKSTAELEKQGILASEANHTQRKALDELTGRLEVQNGTNAEAARNYRLYTAASNDSAFANDETLRSVDRLTDGVGRLGSGLGRIPADTNPKVNVEYNIDDRKLRTAVEKSYTVNIRGQYLDRQGRKILI